MRVRTDRQTDTRTHRQRQTEFTICPMLYAIAMGQIISTSTNAATLQQATKKGLTLTAFFSRFLYKIIRYLSLVRLPSVLLHCWLGGRKGIRPVKKWGDGGGGQWVVRTEWCPAGWSVYLPLLIIPCTIKSRSSLLAPAHPKQGRKTVVVLCGGSSCKKNG